MSTRTDRLRDSGHTEPSVLHNPPKCGHPLPPPIMEKTGFGGSFLSDYLDNPLADPYYRRNTQRIASLFVRRGSTLPARGMETTEGTLHHGETAQIFTLVRYSGDLGGPDRPELHRLDVRLPGHPLQPVPLSPQGGQGHGDRHLRQSDPGEDEGRRRPQRNPAFQNDPRGSGPLQDARRSTRSRSRGRSNRPSCATSSPGSSRSCCSWVSGISS